MKKVLLVALTAGLGMACAGVACVDAAGDNPDTRPPAAATPAGLPAQAALDAPAALDAAAVPGAAVAAETRLRSLRSLISRNRETASIAAAVPYRFESIEELAEWTRVRTPRQQTTRALRSLGQEWRTQSEQLKEWMESIGRRLDALTKAGAEVSALDAVWTATRDNLASTGSEPEILAPAKRVLGSIQEIEESLRKETDTLLLLQNRISGKRLDAEEALDAIDADLKAERKALLVKESPPLWKVLATAPPERESLATEVDEALADGRRAVAQYTGQAGRRLQAHLLLIAALTVAFFRLKPRSAAWPVDDRGVRACASVVGRPFIGAWLIAFLLSPYVHPRAPLAFVEMMLLLSIPPLLTVMTGIVSPRMRGPLWTLAGLFVIERLWELTWAGSVLERLVLLGMTLFSAGLMVWAIFPGQRAAEAFTGRWRTAATVAGRVGLAALAVSAVSNVLGNVSLARLLTSTVVQSAYLAVVLYAAALLLRGTLTLFLATPAARSILTLSHHEELIRRRGGVAIDIAAIGWWALRTLAAAGFSTTLQDAVRASLGRVWGFGAFSFSFGSALVFVATIYASVLLSRLIRVLLEDDVYPRVGLPRGVPGTLTMLIRYGLITLGVLLAAAVAGIPIDRLTLVFGALGVGIGFGLQSVVNNFVSGLILMFERPIQVGDTVEVGGLLGRVRKIGVRACTIQTFEGADVIVPNGTLVSDQLINWTLSNRDRRIEIQVGVAYGTDPVKVISLLRDAALECPKTLAQPEPIGLFRGHGDSALNFSLLFWTGDFEGWLQVKSEVATRVDALFREAGIEIPFPQRDVRIRS